MFKDRAFVSAKGCFDQLLHPTEVCVNLGEATNVLTKKGRFYCNHNFPKDCSAKTAGVRSSRYACSV